MVRNTFTGYLFIHFQMPSTLMLFSSPRPYGSIDVRENELLWFSDLRYQGEMYRFKPEESKEPSRQDWFSNKQVFPWMNGLSFCKSPGSRCLNHLVQNTLSRQLLTEGGGSAKVGQRSVETIFLSKQPGEKTTDLCLNVAKRDKEGARPPRDHWLISRRLDSSKTHLWKTVEGWTAQVI